MNGSALKEILPSVTAIGVAAATGQPMAYAHYGPGESITDPRPGDVVLIRGSGWLGKAIRFFVRIRCRRNGDRPFAHWSHAGIIVSPQGHLIEVLHTGVEYLDEMSLGADDNSRMTPVCKRAVSIPAATDTHEEANGLAQPPAAAN